MINFCVLVSLLFLFICLFFNLAFTLSVLFDRSFSISLYFSIVQSTLDIFITDVFKSLLLVVSVLCESFYFTGVAFSSAIFRNRFLSCGLITSVCITSLFFESQFINEFMILSLFLSFSLINDICSSRCSSICSSQYTIYHHRDMEHICLVQIQKYRQKLYKNSS